MASTTPEFMDYLDSIRRTVVVLSVVMAVGFIILFVVSMAADDPNAGLLSLALRAAFYGVVSHISLGFMYHVLRSLRR